MYAIREVRKPGRKKVTIDIPEPLRERAIEIIVLPAVDASNDADWPVNFFEDTAGCFADAPLVREEQGSYSMRAEIK